MHNVILSTMLFLRIYIISINITLLFGRVYISKKNVVIEGEASYLCELIILKKLSLQHVRRTHTGVGAQMHHFFPISSVRLAQVPPQSFFFLRHNRKLLYQT